jgi:hypothetical protein
VEEVLFAAVFADASTLRATGNRLVEGGARARFSYYGNASRLNLCAMNQTTGRILNEGDAEPVERDNGAV